MLNVIIGRRIRECRLKKELTQEKLADYLNVSHQMISKWENGITTPDIEIMLSLSKLFETSIDYLCGEEKGDMEKITEEIIHQCPHEDIKDFKVLYGKYAFLDAKMKLYPLNEELLAYSLRYLRHMHDTVDTEVQKKTANELILKNAERLLDISKNDDFRSLANFNLAVYYSEQIKMAGEPLPEQKQNARKAREYAGKVYYKDMAKTCFNAFGAENQMEICIAYEKTLKEMTEAVNRTVKVLSRQYKRQNMTEKLDRLTQFSEDFIRAQKALSNN